jgi:uncharacterized protein with von Willebrand factor type A (vWA) domain
VKTRYSRWDGTQDPLGTDLDVGEVLDEISDDLLSGFGPRLAMRRLLRRGVDGRLGGLDELRQRIRERRDRLSRGLNLEGPLQEIQDELNEILATERAALAEDSSDDARFKETTLDNLPEHPAGRVQSLRGYEFASPEAKKRFDELVERIQKEVLGAYFSHLAGALQNITPEEVARMREMLRELNEMVAARERGDEYDFEGFMGRYGDFFPENPRTLDELLEILARRMAAMSRLMASLSPDQRRQLQELSRSVLDDMDVAFQMDQLAGELRQLMPNLPWDSSMSGWGDDDMPLSAAVDAIDRIGELEDLESTIAGDYAGADLGDIDEEKLQRALGDDAVKDVRRLKQIEKMLEEAGIVVRSRGHLELTARGARRLGERALIKVFEDLRLERPGSHDSRRTGGAAEPTGSTRPWQFGDTGEFAVQRTVFNAIVRSASDQESQGARIKLAPEDFELVDAETRTQTATALLLDLSYSMPLRGHWVHAKRMALALHALIEGKYPEDRLYLIGFSDYARRLDPKDLTAEESIERVYGTNMQHAFLLARRLLSEHPRASKQVIMVTDGEPTAHLVDYGPEYGPQAYFSWPPTSETIHLTLAEAMRLSSAGVTLNIFMLEDEPGLVRFMERLASQTGGRVFHTASSRLGDYILRDYVRRRE